MSDTEIDRGPVGRFEKQYLRDAGSLDGVQELAEYLERFPGNPLGVARRYLQLWDLTHASGSGERLGRYRLVRELGRGAQGVVHLAEDSELRRKVALKVLLGTGLSHESLQRFRREAEAATRLQNSGICGVLDAEFSGAMPYIVMPLVEGQTLAKWLEERRGQRMEAQRVAMAPPVGVIDASTALVIGLSGVEEKGGERSPSSSSKKRGDPDTGSRSAVVREVDRGRIDAAVLIVEQIARAMHMAHEGGIVHRDLKPSNVMLRDGGEP